MAKGDTVYSLFGMKSPQQVAREQMLASQKLLQSQRDPYARLGTALGMGLGRMFGGASPEMQRAKQFQDIVAQAKGDVKAQRAEQEAQAQAQLDEKLGGIEGALLSEATGRGALPEIKKPELSREEQMMRTFEDAASRYDAMATRLDAVPGFEAQAEAARNKATEARLKVFGLQKTLADIRKAQQVQAPKTRTRIEGDKKIVEQWDGSKWNFVSEGDRYKPAGAIDPITEALGEQTVKKFGEYETQIAGAQSSLNNLSTMEKLLDQDIITGTFANSRLAVEKALAQAGIIDGTRVANTEAFLAAAANQTIKLLETGALGSGTAVSDKDKEFMQQAAGGRIELTEDAIRRIIRINKQVAREAFGVYNTFVNTASSRFPEQSALFGGPKYYAGQRMQSGDTVIVFDPNLGWLNEATGEPYSE